MLGPPVEITSDKDPAWLTISLFCIKQVHNKLLTLLAIILEFGALVWYVTNFPNAFHINLFDI